MAIFKMKKLKIEQAIEGRIFLNDQRTYLGISSLGNPCARAIYYEFRWYLPPEELTPRKKRLFNRGHREEPIILKDLKKAGVKVKSTQKRTVYAHGHGQGHLDAVLANIPDAPKTDHLGEFKTSATKYFNPLIKSQSVAKSMFSHYCQCQGYMHKFKLKRCLYICVNKEDDRRYYERIKYDKNFALGLFEKAEAIILSTTPPPRLNESPNYYRCGEKWCEYRGICHFPTAIGSEVNKTCRSCNSIQVHDKGRWYCTRKKEFRNSKWQRKGCKKWHI